MSPLRSRSSAPSLRWLCPTERIPGGHTSVGAMPRSYQVTPAILDGGGRHGKSRSDPKVDRRKRVSPPPSESQTDEPDDTDRRGVSFSLRRGAGLWSSAAGALLTCWRAGQHGRARRLFRFVLCEQRRPGKTGLDYVSVRIRLAGASLGWRAAVRVALILIGLTAPVAPACRVTPSETARRPRMKNDDSARSEREDAQTPEDVGRRAHGRAQCAPDCGRRQLVAF